MDCYARTYILHMAYWEVDTDGATRSASTSHVLFDNTNGSLTSYSGEEIEGYVSLSNHQTDAVSMVAEKHLDDVHFSQFKTENTTAHYRIFRSGLSGKETK